MNIQDVNSFLGYYTRIRERTEHLLSVVRPGDMNFTYKHGKFTIADEIRHIAAMERYMFAENVAGRPGRYTGCGPELADGYEDVFRFFHEMHAQSMDIFRSLSNDDLKRKCITPGNTEILVWKWLRAMIEHEIHHRAQLYIYLNLLDIDTPPIFGLTAEEVERKSNNGNKK